MDKKSTPNLLSITRIIMSLVLVLFFQNPSVFIPLYLLIGLTDVLDGMIARKTNAESDLGAKLDSIGDVVFYFVLVVYFFITHKEVVVDFCAPVLFIIAVRLINILIGFAKHKRLVMIHTITNKCTGLMIFVLPVLLIFSLKKILLAVLFFAFLAAIEELLIILISKKGEVDLNCKSVLKISGWKSDK